MRIKYLLAIACCLAVTMPLQVGATLIGDTITAQLSNPANNDPSWNLDFGSAVVGPGTEFSGTNTDAFNQVWDTSVDVGASSFTVSWTGTSNAGGEANIFDGDNFIRLALSDLDWVGVNGSITNVSLVNYTVELNSANNIIFNADSLSVDFKGIWSGDTYTFDIEATHVPEPTTLALLSLGLAGLGFTRRRMKV